MLALLKCSAEEEARGHPTGRTGWSLKAGQSHCCFLGGIFHQLSLSETYVQDFITYQNSLGEPFLNVSSSFCSTLAVFDI